MPSRKIGDLRRRRSDNDPTEEQLLPRGLRGEIAYLAARLIAEDGICDFAAAKQKAARQLGVTTQGLLPDNHELDAALRSHQAIFQSDSQPAECHILRQIAADAMRWLDRFSPWLVGTVLSGSANRFSRIELEIVADDAKQMEIFFFNEGVHFETRISRADHKKTNSTPDEISIYEVSFNESSVRITVYPHHAMRVARQRRDSLENARAKLADVETLIAPRPYCVLSNAAASKAK